MAKILFVWELGADYGHLAQLLPVARVLMARGHAVVFAVRDLLGAESILTPHGIKAFQAPIWQWPVTNLPPPISYPEMLLGLGFLHTKALTGLARAWRNLLDLWQPDLLVLDHSPTALLATHGQGLPRLQLTNSFGYPPQESPMRPFHWWQPEVPVRLADSEQLALNTANAVLSALGEPPLQRFADLLRCDTTLVCTFADLDVYARAEPEEFVGPLFSLGLGAPVVWPQGDAPKVFAYLKASYEGVEQILAALHGLLARVLVHVPGLPQQTINRYSSAAMVFSTQPFDMETVRSNCDLALCHSGVGMPAALLLAGKPLVLFPMHIEHSLNARRLVETGAAINVPKQQLDQLPSFLTQALVDSSLRKAAVRFASRHQGYDQARTIAGIADRCEALLAKGLA